jgi:hypothetical protein
MVERGVEAEMRAELTLDEKLATRRALTVDARLRFGADVLPAFGPISEESERNRERRLIAEAERAAMRLFFARIARNVRSELRMEQPNNGNAGTDPPTKVERSRRPGTHQAGSARPGVAGTASCRARTPPRQCA